MDYSCVYFGGSEERYPMLERTSVYGGSEIGSTMGYQMGSDMVSLRDCHWGSRNMAQKQEVM